MTVDRSQLAIWTTDIVSAFVGGNQISAAQLPGLIRSVHATLDGLANGAAEALQAEPLKPAVPVRRSITPDAIICLEDGKPFKSMKRHLMVKFGLTPAAYRDRWGLPADYPMVAPAYARARSEFAVKLGLGRPRSNAAVKAAKSARK